jgi:predicted ATP-grasp superfamily ATP-dependent carboligase
MKGNPDNEIPGEVPSSDKSPALLLGCGVTLLGVMRCLGRSRIPAYCLSGGLGFEKSSRWYRPLGPGIGAYAGAKELEDVLSSLRFERAVLIACSDQWTIETPRISETLKARYRTSMAETGVVRRFINKSEFAKLLAAAQVPHPFTVFARTKADVVGISKESGGRLFLKPTDSQRFLQRFGKKAFRIDDPARAVEVFEQAQADGLDVLVQEYVPGPSDRHYFVDGFVDRSHRVHAAFGRRRLRMFPPDFGNSSYMISVPLSELAEAVATLETLFVTAEYRGIFSAEFKLDERDGRFKILEVNCRPWWYVQFAAECGVNVVEMAYRDALGHRLTPVAPYEAGVRLVYPYYDSQALKLIRKEGGPALRLMLSSWAGAKSPVFAWDDPAPALGELFERIRARYARRPA